MPTKTRDLEIASGDTLWKIAKKQGTTVKEILALNPQLGNGNRLAVGQHIKIPDDTMGYTVRFLNLLKKPPVGLRYQIKQGQQVLGGGKVTESDSEVTVRVREGSVIDLLAQRMGEAALAKVASVKVTSKPPVVILQINSAKIPSKTEPHPKTPVPPPPPKPAPKPKPPPPPAATDQGMPHSKGSNPQGQPEHTLIPGDCACGKDLTIDQLVAVFPSRKKAALEPFLAPMNSMMKKYAIDSCLRKSHALAQIGHESGGLRFLAEILPKGVKEADVYDGYKGRGLIQLTYKRNYENYGKYVGKDFLGENKVKLEEVANATDSAGWFWNHGAASDLNPYADANDLLQISSSINGAFNGFDDRVAIFKRAHKALNAPKCKTDKNRSPVYLTFEKSVIYGKRDVAFAWALWSDPDSKKHGVPKDATVAKAAYKRFLELNTANPIKKPRFGFKKTADMIKLATDKSK